MGRTSDAKEKLLDVAFELIWDNSYGGVSVDQICERAKVNKGSFYYYFETKADLVVAAYEDHWRCKQPELDRIFSPQVPPLDRLSKWCQFMYLGQKAKAEKLGHVCGCPYASVGGELATQDDKIREIVQVMMERSIKYLESAVADAKREGLATAEDPKQAAEMLYSFALGALLQAKVRNDVEVMRNLEPTVMAIIGARAPVAA